MFPEASSSSCEKTWAGLSERGSVILPETQGWGIGNPDFACPPPSLHFAPHPQAQEHERSRQWKQESARGNLGSSGAQSSAESGLQSSAGSKPPPHQPAPSWHITPKHPNSPASRPLLRGLRLP